MKRKLWAGILVLLGCGVVAMAGALGWHLNRYLGSEPAVMTTLANSAAETRILAALNQMRDTGQKRFGVPEADGRRLRVLAEAIGARNVVEIGTSTGYSGLWLSLGVLPAGGHVTTFEIDPGRAAAAREIFKRAGVADRITVVEGDAHKTVASVEGPVDLVFFDADKSGYPDYLNQLLPKLRRGGLILAHNTNDAPAFLAAVAANPELETVFLTQGSAFSLTLKKR
jgi:caffeoyl-CoA O-methyltransferase